MVSTTCFQLDCKRSGPGCACFVRASQQVCGGNILCGDGVSHVLWLDVAGSGELDFQNLDSEKGFDAWQVYSNTKLCVRLAETKASTKRAAGDVVDASTWYTGTMFYSLMSSTAA